MKDLEKKFRRYKFEIEIPDKENFNPLNEIVEIILTTKAGKKYSANITTPQYLPWVFEKNKKTGECDNGTWWAKPDNLIYVKKISRRNIRIAINRAVENNEIESYLTEII